jgi:hypothetical protein
MASPESFVELDPEMPLALLDQKRAGKKLMVITNSDWAYARFMLDYAVTPFLPNGMDWRELFDVTVVGARKPFFFSERAPIFRIVDDSGLLEPLVGPPAAPGLYFGGHAAQIEAFLGVRGESILYVGDHVYTDVNVSKKLQRWRTALVLRELERELRAIEGERQDHALVDTLMTDKTRLGHEMHAARLGLLRLREGYGPAPDPSEAPELEARLEQIASEITEIDARLGPILADDGRAFSKVWGLLLRAGNDKSHLTRQIERHADIYTSRVSNFLGYTPYAYFRAPRGGMPHDEG